MLEIFHLNLGQKNSVAKRYSTLILSRECWTLTVLYLTKTAFCISGSNWITLVKNFIH